MGSDGEERPGPMRPGDRECSVLVGNKSVATRTYEMQRNAQWVERREDAVHGALFMAYGLAGVVVTVVTSAGSRSKNEA